MTLVAYGPPKYCPDCGHKRPRSDFYAKRQNGIVYARDLCKKHDKARAVAWQKANPTKVKRSQSRTHVRRMQDPERAAVRRDQGREVARRRHGVTPDRYRPSHMKVPKAEDRGGRLPVEPFARWLESLGDSSMKISLVTGLADRQVRAYLNRERDLLLDVADRALLEAGTDMSLVDLWPDRFGGACR